MKFKLQAASDICVAGSFSEVDLEIRLLCRPLSVFNVRKMSEDVLILLTYVNSSSDKRRW